MASTLAGVRRSRSTTVALTPSASARATSTALASSRSSDRSTSRSAAVRSASSLTAVEAVASDPRGRLGPRPELGDRRGFGCVGGLGHADSVLAERRATARSTVDRSRRSGPDRPRATASAMRRCPASSLRSEMSPRSTSVGPGLAGDHAPPSPAAAAATSRRASAAAQQVAPWRPPACRSSTSVVELVAVHPDRGAEPHVGGLEPDGGHRGVQVEGLGQLAVERALRRWRPRWPGSRRRRPGGMCSANTSWGQLSGRSSRSVFSVSMPPMRHVDHRRRRIGRPAAPPRPASDEPELHPASTPSSTTRRPAAEPGAERPRPAAPARRRTARSGATDGLPGRQPGGPHRGQGAGQQGQQGRADDAADDHHPAAA